MTNSPPRRTPAARADLDAAAYQFWRWLPSRSCPTAALFGFFLTLVTGVFLLNLINAPLFDFLRTANIRLRGIDVFNENSNGAYVLKDYLHGPSSLGCRHVAVIGASYTTTTAEPEINRRLDKALARDLTALTKQPWCGVSLGTNGYDTWSNFYISRLVRYRRPPDVLIIGMDWLDAADGNRWLVLATGADIQLLSTRELLPVVPLNQQPIFRAEAIFQEKFNKLFPFIETFRRSRPRGLLEGLARATRSGFKIPVSPPAPHGQPWQASSTSRALIEKLRKQQPLPLTISPVGQYYLDILGKELQQCRSAGIQVYIVTLPRNPLVPLDVRGAREILNNWAEHYQLTLIDLWESNLIPTEFFTDTAHFFGDGVDLVSAKLSSKIKESQP